MTRWFFSTATLAVLLSLSCSSGNEAGPNNPVIIETRAGPVHLDEYLFYLEKKYPELEGTIDDEMQTYILNGFLRDLVIAEIQRVTDEQVDAVMVKNLSMVETISNLEPRRRELWSREIKRRLAIRQFLTREIIAKARVTDEVIAHYYTKNKERFKNEPLYQIRFVQTGTDYEKDTAAAERAAGLRKALSESEKPFPEVAASFAENDGHLIAIQMTLADLSEPFRKCIKRLKPGHFSPIIPVKRVIPSEKGESKSYYVLYLESVIDAVEMPFEDAYHQIREELERERAHKLLNEKVRHFREKIPVKVYKSRLPFTYDGISEKEEV